MRNVHPYFPLKYLGEKRHIIHGKIQCLIPLSPLPLQPICLSACLVSSPLQSLLFLLLPSDFLRQIPSPNPPHLTPRLLYTPDHPTQGQSLSTLPPCSS